MAPWARDASLVHYLPLSAACTSSTTTNTHLLPSTNTTTTSITTTFSCHSPPLTRRIARPHPSSICQQLQADGQHRVSLIVAVAAAAIQRHQSSHSPHPHSALLLLLLRIPSHPRLFSPHPSSSTSLHRILTRALVSLAQLTLDRTAPSAASRFVASAANPLLATQQPNSNTPCPIS